MITRPEPPPPTTPLPATRAELRTRYARIKRTLETERRMRESVLAHSPQLKAKLAEIDTALEDLRQLGEWIKALLPPEAEQQPLIQAETPRGY